jgi:hypothetical protein
MIKVTLTSYNGNAKHLPFYSAEQVHNFISALPAHLNKNTSLKVECDLLAISGTLRGEK